MKNGPDGPFSLIPGGEGGIRTRGGLLAPTRFPGVRLKPLIHLSVKPAILAQAHGVPAGLFLISAIDVAISEATSLMLPGTIMVLFFWASWA